jgi:hypothetical protein
MKFTKTLEQGLTRGLGLRYVLRVASKARLIPESKQLELGLVDRPHYAYGLRRAAVEAKGLGYSSVTAIEFGVAGGNGLLALEEYARRISREFTIDIRVVGFDTGQGLPAPVDYRDLPHLWAAGDFDMNVGRLKSRLQVAELQLGLVADTVPAFLESHSFESPIGFVSFDLDLWSSTMQAFGIFRSNAEHCLPRTWCYFDDIVETVQDVGELLAIDQFNEESHGRKIRRPYMLRDNVPFQPAWAEQLFQVHLFDNPRYTHLLTATENRNLPLRN